MRVLITGGGTGGHIYPALAIAQTLKDDPDISAILYVGKNGGLENDIIPAAGFDFEGIDFRGMPRGNPFKFAVWAVQLLQTIRHCEGIIKRFKPDVIIGTGGYVSGPILGAAKNLKIPYVVHEPDAQPGQANLFMAQKADAITAAFEISRKLFTLKEGATFYATGNPIRSDIGTLTKEAALEQLNSRYGLGWTTEKPTVLVFGGSQGARSINQALVPCLDELLNTRHLQILHITGKTRHDETLAQLKAECPDALKNPAYRIEPFFDAMAAALNASDFAVCRAGSLSLSEMFASGLPTILIPYPHAAADHQTKNAQATVEAGAALMLADLALNPTTLMASLNTLLDNPSRLQAMRDAAKTLARPNATTEIVRILKEVALLRSGGCHNSALMEK